MAEDDRFDGIFMNVIQQKQGIEGFFESVFSFLRRKTDFFQDQKKAEKVIIDSCKIQFDNYEKQSLEKKKKDEERKKREEAIKAQQAKKIKTEEPVKEKKAPQVVANEAHNEEPKQVVAKTEENKDQDKKDEDDKTPPPKGNGGKTDLYIWTQTLEELHMYIFLDPSIGKKNLNINIQPKTLTVAVNGTKIIDGEWFEQIHADGTIWTIEDGEVQDYNGKTLHIAVEKWKSQFHWWETPVKGHDKINTQKIQPENSNLSDLDGETRGTVEKMMFDMRQKQMGKPSSDELLKQDKLQDFMKAHPEMDFSKCKFN